MIEAAKIAQAHEFIEKMPSGYDGTVEQNGRNLSGGQRQRLSIARGVAKNARLLILDDSSSALDYLTERRLRAALKTMKNTAKIIISQRASSVAGADNILVLEKGRQIGYGKHSELLEGCPAYRNIWETQQI